MQLDALKVVARKLAQSGAPSPAMVTERLAFADTLLRSAHAGSEFASSAGHTRYASRFADLLLDSVSESLPAVATPRRFVSDALQSLDSGAFNLVPLHLDDAIGQLDAIRGARSLLKSAL